MDWMNKVQVEAGGWDLGFKRDQSAMILRSRNSPMPIDLRVLMPDTIICV